MNSKRLILLAFVLTTPFYGCAADSEDDGDGTATAQSESELSSKIKTCDVGDSAHYAEVKLTVRHGKVVNYKVWYRKTGGWDYGRHGNEFVDLYSGDSGVTRRWYVSADNGMPYQWITRDIPNLRLGQGPRGKDTLKIQLWGDHPGEGDKSCTLSFTKDDL
jgi:hypothetical protein